MSEILRICNVAHKCPVDGCPHKVPHKPVCGNGTCGPSMPCHDYPKEVSMCVEVKDDTYITHHREWCKECGGRGFTDIKTEHHIQNAKGERENDI